MGSLGRRIQVFLSASYERMPLLFNGTALPVFLIVALLAGASGLLFFNVSTPVARADNLQTSLTVLNTPPAWTVDAQEATQSSTSTPTNAGATLSFIGTATDSSNDNYWLLICSASSTPVANNNRPPDCSSGIMWARSATTTSGSQATAATTTIEKFPFNQESNPWYAYICDGNSTGAQCNAVMKQGTAPTVSPFVINHPPMFFSVSNNSPQNPGATVTWTAVASDTDMIRGGDTVKLMVCKATDYITAATSCGAGGTWATSTQVLSNPATSTPIVIPSQDKTYNAFVYVSDQSGLNATSTFQGSASSFVVNNVAPTVTAATISLVDPATAGSTTFLTPTQPAATSGPYYVKFTAVDNNGCQNASAGNEIALATTSIYRTAIGQSACQTVTNSNTNNCYPSADPATNITCVQDGGSCSGATDSDATFTCTFSLWYNADATVPSSQYSSDSWSASVQVKDDNNAVSPTTQGTTPNEVDQLLAFSVSQTGISFGGLQPGQKNDPLATTTTMLEQGNVGLDQSLYGDTMCTTWTGHDTCDVGGADATRKIPVANQHFATSSVVYASGATLTGSTTPASLAIHIQKTTATSSPQSKNTYWGINVPGTITVAGSYQGQDTITAVTSNSSFW
jgi:hypothetical protein